MNNQQLLTEFGFTQYDTKVYLALAKLGNAKASEVAKLSLVPPNKVYESLIKLAEKGFIATLGITPSRYQIINLATFKDLIEAQEKKVSEMKKTIVQLEKDISSKNIEEGAIVLRGKDKLLNMLREANQKSTSHIYSMSGDLHFSFTNAKYVKECVSRGVDVRYLCHPNPKHKHVVKQWQKVGVQVRYYSKDEHKSMRFSTFDDRECRITIGSPEIAKEEDYLTFWIESAGMSKFLKEQFLGIWEKSKKA